ncbi:MAG: transcriptional repressor [Bacteroides sp.]|nr:transcriptional repressor [Bacteroides sp.]MCM1085245.1 transcriptional repressor [Bacteroides sp.]
MKDGKQILEHKHIKLTPNRILVLDALLKVEHPVSMIDLDAIIQTMDRSSIFRVLNLFHEHDIVHSIEDGSGILKYEVCSGEDHCSIADMHVHFYCESCHSTTCFEAQPIPMVKLPPDFTPHSVNYMIKGLCPACSRKG